MLLTSPIAETVLSRPRLAIRVSFIGKRNLQAPGENEQPRDGALRARAGLLEDRVAEVLQLIEEEVRALVRRPEFGEIYSDEDPRLIAVSSLASGSDTIACQALQRRVLAGAPWELHVILPFDRERFKNAGLPSQEEKDNFDKLIFTAAVVREMDLPESQGSEEQVRMAMIAGYDASGSVTIDYSDIVLAIWDGKNGGGPGGTKSSIDKAREAHVPVVHIPIDGKGQSKLYPEGQDIGELRNIIPKLLGIPENDAHDKGCLPRHRFSRFLEESDPRWTPSFVFAGARKLLLLAHRPRVDSKVYSPAPRWLETPEFKWPDELAPLVASEKKADRLAEHYAARTRAGFTATALLGAFGLSAAITQKLWPGSNVLSWLEIAGAAASVGAIVLYLINRHAETHQRWIEYRMLAELLYSSASLVVVGATPRLQAQLQHDHSEFSGWVKWYLDALVRNLGLSPIGLSVEQRKAYREMLVAKIDGQLAYHGPRFRRNAEIARRIKMVNTVMFIVLALSCLLQLTALAGWFPFALPDSLKALLVFFTSASILCTIASASLAGFAAQAEFAKLAQISRIMEGQLTRLREGANASSPTGENLRRRGSEIVDMLLKEHEDWYLFYSLRDPDAPT